MNRLFFVLLAAAVFVGGVGASASATGAQDAYAVATYFHGTVRCPTCRKLEEYSKEAVQAFFKDEIASGRLQFKTVNVDEKGNAHYTDDYKLYTKSLILSQVKDGKELRWKNLDKIWEYVRDKKQFIGYVQKEVSDFLKT